MNLATMTPAIVDHVLVETTVGAKATKATNRQKVAVAKKTVKKSWHVSLEAIQRLGVQAAMELRSQSSIVDELLCGLNRYTKPAENNRGSKGTPKTADTQEDRQNVDAA